MSHTFAMINAFVHFLWRLGFHIDHTSLQQPYNLAAQNRIRVDVDTTGGFVLSFPEKDLLA